MPTNSNARQFIKNSKALDKTVEFATRKATEGAARRIQNDIRDNIPPPRGAGRFPGYAASGTLRAAVTYTKPKQNRGLGGRFSSGWYTRVYMRKNASKRYQRIHELGGVIRPKSSKWLIFPKPPSWAPRSRPIPGNKAYTFIGRSGQVMVAAKAVRIKRKRYFSEGVKSAQRRLPNEVKIAFIRERRSRG